jgi:hypothetical protein
MLLIVHPSAPTLCESKDFMEKDLAIDLREPDTISLHTEERNPKRGTYLHGTRLETQIDQATKRTNTR